MTRALVALLVVLAFAAWGAPPPDSDGRYRDWFRSLKQPGTDVSCCDLTDCRSVEYRITPDGYQALITPQTHGQLGVTEPMWVDVPVAKTLPIFSQTGRAVACWTPHAGIICFVKAMEI